MFCFHFGSIYFVPCIFLLVVASFYSDVRGYEIGLQFLLVYYYLMFWAPFIKWLAVERCTLARILSFSENIIHTYFGAHIVTDQKVVKSIFSLRNKRLSFCKKRCLEAIRIVKKRCDGKFMFLQYLYLDIHTNFITQLQYNG